MDQTSTNANIASDLQQEQKSVEPNLNTRKSGIFIKILLILLFFALVGVFGIFYKKTQTTIKESASIEPSTSSTKYIYN